MKSRAAIRRSNRGFFTYFIEHQLVFQYPDFAGIVDNGGSPG